MSVLGTDVDVLKLVANLVAEAPQKFIDFEAIGKRVLDRKKAGRKVKRKRVIHEPRCPDYWATKWGQWLLDPRTRDPDSHQYKAFRNKFRMPFPLFQDIFVPDVREMNIFPQKYFGSKQIPLEIKCLIALRMLGRGNFANDMEELSFVKMSTVNLIFKHFIKNFSAKLFSRYVHPPEGERRKHVMDTYARLGFPGAVGSVDCTHILWNKCPVALSNLCKGKEKYPSLSFELVVDHERRIHSCTDGFIGTAPDSVIVVNDEYCRAISDGKYADIEYSVYKQDGSFKTIRGAYLISDNGYPKQWMFQRPSHSAVQEKSVVWSEFLESVRKDVECTFGILKARFHFLQQFVLYHDPAILTHAVKTCCILHNMLLSWDAGARMKSDWEDHDPDDDGVDVHRHDEIARARFAAAEAAGAPVLAHNQSGLTLLPPTDGATVLAYQTNRHSQLQSALQDHFEFAYKRGAVVWPKGFTAVQRADFARVGRGCTQSERRVNNVLYKAPSYLRTDGARDKVGLGLFSCLSYRTDEPITKFVGEVISREEYDQRVQAGGGGYCIQLTHTTVLDCFNHRQKCYGSHANTANNCRTLQPPVEGGESDEHGLFTVQNNCRISVSSVVPGTVHLFATRNIPAHRELLFPYGVAYNFPA